MNSRTNEALRVLQPRLPTLLASPLPHNILSPHISLHLFPSTHPHLPTANGRVAYHAALWTAPISWGCVPLVGNVELEILSERMVKKCHMDQLVVRWRTLGKTKGRGTGALYRGIGAKDQVDKITHWLGGSIRDDEEFTGLFIFEFDEHGRILTHTIEHAEQNGGDDRTNRMVSITDWLLSHVNRKQNQTGLALGFSRDLPQGKPSNLMANCR